MKDYHKVQLKVVGGNCVDGTMKIGQTFAIDSTTPDGVCLGAFSAILPYILTLRYGGNFPWEREEGYGVIHCPDPHGGITMEIRRVES